MISPRAGPLSKSLLGSWGEFKVFFLSLLFLNNQFKINIPKGIFLRSKLLPFKSNSPPLFTVAHCSFDVIAVGLDLPLLVQNDNDNQCCKVFKVVYNAAVPLSHTHLAIVLCGISIKNNLTFKSILKGTIIF